MNKGSGKGSQTGQDILNQNGGGGTKGSKGNSGNSDPYAIPWTKEQETQADIRKLETQMHNYLAANGGQVSHNTLPVLSGFAEQIAALQNTLNQPEAEKETGKYATLGEAYADSVANGETFGLGFSGDEGNREQEIAQLSTDGSDARSGENDATSPIVPIAGGLYYNTETGEYVDNYNYEGNESAVANSAGEGSGVSDGDNSSGGVTNADDSSSSEGTTQDVGQSEELDSERVKELMELIRDYKSDELNSVIDPNSFSNKYPEGENTLLGWQEELIGLIGEEYYNEYMDGYADWVPFDNQAQQKHNEFVDEQEKRKQLSDLEIMREDLLGNMGEGIPTTSDIVQLGEIDAQIKELTQELGLGSQEYTPGVEGGWQDETEQAEGAREETVLKNHAKNLWEQLVNCDSLLHQDAFLKDHGFSLGIQGYMEVWQTVERVLGREEFEAYREELKPDATSVFVSPDAEYTPPSIDGDYGTINVEGEDIKIIPWTWEHNNHEYEVIDTYRGQVTEWSLANFMLDTNFEVNEDGESDIGTDVTNALLLVHKALSSFTHSYASVDVLDVDGEKRAVIKVSDSAWDSAYKEAGRELNDLVHGTSITLDERHNEGEFGYIYIEGDKMILRPLIYPDDKYLVFQDNEYVDITNQMRRDYEVPEEMVEWIEEALSNAGLTIDFS